MDLAPQDIDDLDFHRGTLDAADDKILGTQVLVANHPDFLEPALGVITGDRFRFVANSGWPHFNTLPEDREALRKKLPPTVVLEIDLTK